MNIPRQSLGDISFLGFYETYAPAIILSPHRKVQPTRGAMLL